jgi:replicative DNA helicase
LEKLILAELLEANSYLDAVAEFIGRGDFVVPAHVALFVKMCDMRMDGDSFDTQSLSVCGDPEIRQTVIDLADACGYPGNVVSHARQLKELSTKDECLRLLTNSVADIEDGGKVGAVIDHLQSKLYRIERIERMKAVVLQDLPESVFKERQGIYTGFAPLKNIKLVNGAMVVVAGRPSMGKTAFCLKIALNVAHTNTPVMIYSLEMSLDQVYHRLVSMNDKIPLTQFAEENTEAFNKAKLSKCRSLPIYIDDDGSLTIEQLRRTARDMIRKHGVKLIIIDYLQKMNGAEGQSKYEETTDIANGIKAIAKELDVPVIVACQLNRAVMNTKEKIPGLSDLRGSGAIEENADIVIFPFRPHVYKLQRPKEEGGMNYFEDDAIVYVSKNRQGETGNFPLMWMSPFTLFEHKG